MHMPSISSIDEALGIAVQIEMNGKDFYLQAARVQKSDEDSRELLKLAAMEDTHRETFERMRAAARKAGGRPLGSQPVLYLQAVADSHGGEGDPFEAEALDGSETLEEILWTAVGMEEKSILFYVGLMDILTDAEDRRALDRIVAEERAHVSVLSRLAQHK
jgi:rubrerythrin